MGVGRAAEPHEGSADFAQHPPLLFRTIPNHDEAAASKGFKKAIGDVAVVEASGGEVGLGVDTPCRKVVEEVQ